MVEPGTDANNQHAPTDLSLAEAAEAYDLSIRTLGNRVRNGEIDAHKVRGPWGEHWRVTPAALETFGYHRRVAAIRPEAGTLASSVAELQRDLDAARRAAAAERNRANEADRKLGEAMREIGRLRAALDRAGGRATDRGRTMLGLTQDDVPTHSADDAAEGITRGASIVAGRHTR